jgi:subtilisin family serine protease
MKRFSGLLVSGLIVAASMLTSGPAAEAAPAKLIPATGKALANQYIVVVKEGANARSIAAVAGVSPKYVYAAALNGFAATLNAGQLNALQHHPGVDYIEQDAEVAVEQNGEVGINTTQSGAPWGLDRIDQRSLPLNGTYTYTATGSNVTAYIIDTGIYTAHTDFGGRARNVYDAFGGTGTDCNGQGTHLAGIVGGARYGVAKQVQLRGVRVMDCVGSGSYAGVIAGIDWVRLNAVKPAVALLGLGGSANSSVDTAVTNLANSGVFVAVSAGSSNADACNYSPARASGVMTVGASTSSDTRASFSNYGACVELYAPGVNIISAWHTSTTATNTISGTAQAAAHVAGCAAKYKSTNPTASQSTINSWLVNNATPANGIRILYCPQ